MDRNRLRGLFATAPHRWALVAVVAVLLGGALRVCDLDASGLWMDEGFTRLVASAPLDEVVSTTARIERAPPLYYLTVHAFLAVGDGERAVRAASVVFGVLALAATIWLGWIAFGPAEGALGGLLLSVSALHVMMSRDARAYSMAACLVTLSTGLWLRELRAPGRLANLAAYVVSATLAVYTHYLCLFCVGLQWMCGLRPPRRAVLLPRAGAVACIALAFAPWVPTLMAQQAHTSVGFVPVAKHPAHWTSVPDALFVQAAGFFLNLRWIGLWYAVALGAAVLLALPWRAGRDDALRLLRVVCAGTIFTLLAVSVPGGLGIYNAKYLVLVSPLFWVLTAHAATRLWERRMPFAAGALVVGLLVLNGVSTANLLRVEEWRNQDWRGAVNVVARSARKGDLALLVPAYAGPTVEHYWQRRAVPAQLIGVTPQMASGLSAADIAAAPRVWMLEGEGAMVDPTGHVSQVLERQRPCLLSWEAWRRNRSLSVRVRLYGPPR